MFIHENQFKSLPLEQPTNQLETRAILTNLLPGGSAASTNSAEDNEDAARDTRDVTAATSSSLPMLTSSKPRCFNEPWRCVVKNPSDENDEQKNQKEVWK